MILNLSSSFVGLVDARRATNVLVFVVQDLDDLVEAALEFYGEKSLLDSRPLVPSLERDKDSRLVASPLKFPGKLTTDLVNGRLFISDSNHHRIVRKPKSTPCAFFFPLIPISY